MARGDAPPIAPAYVVALALLGLLLAPLLFAGPAVAATDVRQAQRQLNVLHCDAGRADGRAGARTRSAVIRFQSRHGLRQSGRLDAPTRRLLYADKPMRCDQRPVPSGSGSGRRIVISQQQNWVWLVEADGRVRAQGGIIDNAGNLRPGSYRTGSYCGRAARVKQNSSGSLWLDDFVRFAPCGFGFHRIPRYMSSGKQIHPDWYLGTNLATSHGCLRLSARMAATLWAFTSSRTTTIRIR